jgi:hypothetical protein
MHFSLICISLALHVTSNDICISLALRQCRLWHHALQVANLLPLLAVGLTAGLMPAMHDATACSLQCACDRTASTVTCMQTA